jgi:NAD(P)-dependent dehydrogenase (short-subunit alcohol dehydrogenase family)
MSAPTFSDPVLAGRVAVVTGAGSGLGRAFAIALAQRGMEVWLVGRREAPLIDTAKQMVAPHHLFRGDVTDPDDVAALADSLLRENQRAHVLINNAAILGPVATVDEYPPEDFARVMDINVTGLFRVTHALMPLLRAGAPGAHIINLSSGVGRTGRATWGAYAASKFAVEGLTQVWADELRGTGIAVNALNPGGTRTAMRAAAKPGEDPMTLPTPEDVVPSLLWLLSPEAQAMGVSGTSIDARDFMSG